MQPRRTADRGPGAGIFGPHTRSPVEKTQKQLTVRGKITLFWINHALEPCTMFKAAFVEIPVHEMVPAARTTADDDRFASAMGYNHEPTTGWVVMDCGGCELAGRVRNRERRNSGGRPSVSQFGSAMCAVNTMSDARVTIADAMNAVSGATSDRDGSFDGFGEPTKTMVPVARLRRRRLSW